MKKNRRLNLLVLLISCMAMVQLYGYGNPTNESSIEIACETMATPLECIELTTTHTIPNDNNITLWALDFVLNEDDYDEVLVSLNPNGPFTESFVADCKVGSQTYSVYIRGFIGLEDYNCETTLSIIDDAKPIPSGKNSLILNLENGTATLTPDMVNYGSFDVCGDVEILLSKTDFTSENVGYNTVFLMVTDESGNKSYTYLSVYVHEGSECSLGTVIFPNDIEIYDPSDDYNSLSVENLQSSFNYTYEEVHPYTEVECDDIVYSYTDQVLDIFIGIKVIRTWTALDWVTSEVMHYTQTLYLFSHEGSLSGCHNPSTISVLTGPVKLTALDVAIFSLMDYSDLTLVIKDEDDNVVVDNLVTSDYIGQTLVVELTQGSTGNSCWGFMEVTNDIVGCEVSTVNNPTAEISIDSQISDPASLTPEVLMHNYNYKISDVSMTWLHNDCQVIGISYEDEVTDNGDGSFTIIRNFAAIDYIAYNSANPTAGIWEFSQTITTGINVTPPACNALVNVALDADGEATLFAEVFIEGNPQYDVLEVSLDNVNFGESVYFDCDEIDVLHTVYVHAVQDGIDYNCFSEVLVEDKKVPTPYAITGVTVSMNGGNSASITADMIDGGSYDNCEIVSITLSQYTFTAVGTYAVNMILEDQSGNTDFATVSVIVVAGNPACNEFVNASLSVNGETVLPADVFVEGNADYDVVEVSLDNINFGETVTLTCDDVESPKSVYVHIEQDGNEYNCTSEVTVEDKLPPSVIVKDITIDLDSETDTHTLLVNEVEIESFDNCPDLVKTLSQNEFSSNDWGQNQVILTVTDGSGNSASATSTVTVLINGQSAQLVCVSELTVSTEPWGGPKLWGVDFVTNSSSFDQVLVSLDPAGPYTESFIAPCGINGGDPVTVYIHAFSGMQLSVCSTELTVNDITKPVAIANQNILLVLENGSATLTPEMVDEGSYDSCTDVILSLDKTNFTTDDIGENIVVMTVTDLNGHENFVFTKVIVDDGTGCNLAFVLFPENIEIFDENGTVESLSVQNLQGAYNFTYEEVHPYTIEECEDLNYSFTDEVINFASGLKVIRTWKAMDGLSGEEITFIQILKLHTDLDNLVKVSTGTNRPMPGVIINDLLVTNMEGVVYVENDPVNTIQYEDPKFNGLNVMDLVLIRRQVLGAVIFDESSELAGDINLTNGVSSLDQVLLERHLLGYEGGEDFGWRFYDKVPESQNMKGSYMGIKPGDVDDSALLEGDDPLEPVANFEVNDMLLEEGKTYSVPVYLEKQYTALGIEFRANIDNDLISISDINSNLFSQFNNFNVTDEGILTVLFYHSSSVEEFGGDLLTPVFNIEFEAKENGTLAQALDMDSHFGYLASYSSSSSSSFLELIVLSGKVLNEGIYPSSFICDTLPRTAPAGDCESGHTYDDDVEWPADLDIVDYRISPDELVVFSSVDVLDSKPSFYNNPDDYTATYQDLVVELTNTTLTIGRVWTARHEIYGFTWTYNQTIVVDFSEFDNLVSVSTGTNRAMPGVVVNDAFATNMQGVAYVIPDPVFSMEYEDDYLNGINILDFILIQRHILDMNTLEGFRILASDVNGDDKISANDLVELRKLMLGVITELPTNVPWRFYDNEIESEVTIEPKGSYLGVKTGDVDDSAILQGDESLIPESNFKLNDILLNNGETYSVSVYLQKEYDVFGVEYRAKIDTDIIEVLDVTSDYAPEEVHFYIKDDILTIMFSSFDPIEGIGGSSSDPVFNIELKAKVNSLLSMGIEMENQISYLANSSLELVVLGGELGDVIGTGTNSEELSSLKVYPNPVSDYLNFDVKNVLVTGNMEVSIFALDGQKLFSTTNETRLDVSRLASGMYYYQVKVDGYSTTGKFVVIDR